MAVNDGGLAFPTVPSNNGYSPETSGPGTGSGPGMTLRDYFAAHAPPMPAIAICAYIKCLKTNEPELSDLPWNEWMLKQLANQERRWRYTYADQMIEGKSKPC